MEDCTRENHPEKLRQANFVVTLKKTEKVLIYYEEDKEQNKNLEEPVVSSIIIK